MDQHNGKQDERDFPRIPKNVTMTVKRLQYPLANADPEPAITKDVANRGACFITAEFYETGTLLNLDIDLRGWQQYLQNVFSIIDDATISKPLTVIAEVVWSKKLPEKHEYKVGVQFQDIYEDDLLALQHYLSKITVK